ncbi:chemotaxis protein CheW [Acetobacteraceae bacterium KSS8]|uniref:Chemotaxis protein CheW n=1 Tax=Endosaccharibacter trunci TaxID=2812733 RepID=A0ABT1WA79_9PROT|nr:chemotaxis protein CheW [Acetobacteraceae bacterium KSS8]
MDRVFRERILDERTESLALRGLQADRALLPPRLVCLAGGRHLAVPLEMVSSIRPFGCSPLPLIAAGARGVMLGATLSGRTLLSVLDLAALLDPALRAGDPPGGGKMLILRRAEPAVALRVDRVLGAIRLQALDVSDRALLPDPAAPHPALVSLLEPGPLLATIAALDHA